MQNAEYHAKCRARRQQVVDAATVEAAHAEALEMHNALALVKIADDCLVDLDVEGCSVPVIVGNWNSAARLAGFPLLTLSADVFQRMNRAQIGQIIAFRKTVLDIKVNP